MRQTTSRSNSRSDSRSWWEATESNFTSAQTADYHSSLPPTPPAPHCLAAIFTLIYPRPNCLLKCLPNCLSALRDGFNSSLKITPEAGGNCAVSERQKLSRGNFLPPPRHQDASPQQFTYGVVQEGVIAENVPQISAKFAQTFRTLSWRNKTNFLRTFRRISANFPQKPLC